MKKVKSQYRSANYQSNVPVTLAQVRKHLHDAWLSEDKKILEDSLLSTIPVLIELLDLKIKLLDYHRRSKATLGSRLVFLCNTLSMLGYTDHNPDHDPSTISLQLGERKRPGATLRNVVFSCGGDSQNEDFLV